MQPLGSSAKRLNENGAVWIENRKIFVRDQRGNGIPPTIIPNDEVTLIIDGAIYNHISIVNSKNNIEIEIQEKVEEPSVTITLSKDELYAYLNFKPGIKQMLALKDQEPQNSLMIQMDIIIETFNNLAEEYILEKISEAGIEYGIDEEVIAAVLKAEKEQRFIIAKGLPPIKGKDADVEIFFNDQLSKRDVPSEEEDIIDYRNMFAMNCVKENDVIATKHPCQKGKLGLTVKQTPLYPETPKDINMLAGKGVVVEENGILARALVCGIPRKVINEKDIILEVSELLQINHDIDLNTGNITYSNDIFIDGNVNESMEINSLGNIFIKGNVSFAKISALKDITIQGNVISSKITSGSNNLTGTLLIELENIEGKLNLILQLTEELMQKAAFKIEDIKAKGIGVLIKLLLNLKLKELPQSIFNLFLNAKKGAYGILNDIAFETFESLKIFMEDCTTIKTIEEVIVLKTDVTDKVNKYSSNTSKSTVIINYALNSEILTDGNVNVIGNGCYNTKIHTKGDVFISGIFIGGEIFSEKSVKLSQVGSGSGVKSLIGTSSTGKICARKIFEGNVIKLGSMTYRFNTTEFALNARFVDNVFVLK